MLDEMRKPFFVVALVLVVLALLLEMGSPWLIKAKAAEGLGVASVAVLDALLILTVSLIGMGLLLPERVQGRVQGVVAFIVSLLLLLTAFGMLMMAIGLVSLMLGLLLAPIFGTAAYLAMFGHFDREGAAVVLGLALLLKLGFAVFLVLAHQRFLEMKALVAIIACSLLALLLVSFLHGLVPGVLVSITDTVGAIIVFIVALIWALYFTFNSLGAVISAIG